MPRDVVCDGMSNHSYQAQGKSHQNSAASASCHSVTLPVFTVQTCALCPHLLPFSSSLSLKDIQFGNVKFKCKKIFFNGKGDLKTSSFVKLTNTFSREEKQINMEGGKGTINLRKLL